MYCEFGFHHLGTHAVIDTQTLTARAPHEVIKHPLRAKVLSRIRATEDRLAALEGRYGTHTSRGLVVALGSQASATHQRRWDDLVDSLEDLNRQLDEIPETITRAQLIRDSGREAIAYGPKRVNDVLRVAALNAEHALRDIVQRALPNPRHERRLARMLLRSPGVYTVDDTTMRVRLRAPALPRLRLAAAQTLAALDAMNAVHPAVPHLTLRFELAAASTRL